MSSISFRCSEEEKEQLETRAHIEGVDKTQIIRKACCEYLQSKQVKKDELPIYIICDINTLVNKL